MSNIINLEHNYEALENAKYEPLNYFGEDLFNGKILYNDNSITLQEQDSCHNGKVNTEFEFIEVNTEDGCEMKPEDECEVKNEKEYDELNIEVEACEVKMENFDSDQEIKIEDFYEDNNCEDSRHNGKVNTEFEFIEVNTEDGCEMKTAYECEVKNEEEYDELNIEVEACEVKMEDIDSDQEIKIEDFHEDNNYENPFPDIKSSASEGQDPDISYPSQDYIKPLSLQYSNITSDEKELSSGSLDKDVHSDYKNNLKNCFKCTMCDYQTIDQKHFHDHISNHPNINLFRGRICDLKTKRKINRLTYLKTPKKLTCSECNYAFSKKIYLKRHIRNHRKEAEKMKVKEPIKKQEKLYTCTECDYSSIKKKDLKAHSVVHPKEELFRCFQCDYTCRRKSNLKSHLVIHSTEKLFKCSQCEFECNHKCNLENHIKHHHHSTEKSLKCAECNFTCFTESKLRHHSITHTKEKLLFKCSHCDFSCKVERMFTRHLLTHKKIFKKKLFKCSQCEFECEKETVLKIHSSIHSDECKVS